MKNVPEDGKGKVTSGTGISGVITAANNHKLKIIAGVVVLILLGSWISGKV